MGGGTRVLGWTINTTMAYLSLHAWINVQVQKPPILPTSPPPHRMDWNFWGGGGGGSVRPKNLKKCVKLNLNFQRGGGLRKNPFCGGGMDIFWTYTIYRIGLANQTSSQASSLTPNYCHVTCRLAWWSNTFSIKFKFKLIYYMASNCCP